MANPEDNRYVERSFISALKFSRFPEEAIQAAQDIFDSKPEGVYLHTWNRSIDFFYLYFTDRSCLWARIVSASLSFQDKPT